MSLVTRRLTTTALIAALGVGVGAAPAIASPTAATAKTTLSRAIAHDTPLTRQRISLRTAGQRGEASRLLGQNATACIRFAHEVSLIHADAAQRTAQRDWVVGTELQGHGDRELSAGLIANARHTTATGNREIQMGLKTLDRADGLTGYARELLAGDASGPAPRA